MSEMTIEKPKSVPIGSYIAKFAGTEDTEHDDYGPGRQWKFEVIKGPHTGEMCYRTTKRKPTLKNSCGRFLASLVGKSPEEGLTGDPDQYVGHTYSIIVSAAKEGDGTRVEAFVPVDDPDVPFGDD